MNYEKLLNKLKSRLDSIVSLQDQLDLDLHKNDIAELNTEYKKVERVFEKVFTKVFKRTVYRPRAFYCPVITEIDKLNEELMSNEELDIGEK
mgnify:CR=1 FL=1|tara:strand:- start:315 stop:590 length:276 start_codon:yes stop_codon:yes gene_type:complete